MGVCATLALAALLSVAAIFALWADRQLLDTGDWSTNTQLLQSRAIQARLCCSASAAAGGQGLTLELRELFSAKSGKNTRTVALDNTSATSRAR